MNELFSDLWMKALAGKWNETEKITIPLEKEEFSATITYGFKGEEKPKGVMIVKDGVVIYAGCYKNEKADWDLRATQEKWQSWIEMGFGIAQLGSAITTRALVFEKGNYRELIKHLGLSHPFLNHFALMSKI
ncbi:MAG: SCP-2 sterol transfer family protein [Gammaproteobacteria bacterium]|nr:SCP-2 sterol transfer family protein [Gammaproteobacteria bacterium]